MAEERPKQIPPAVSLEGLQVFIGGYKVRHRRQNRGDWQVQLISFVAHDRAEALELASAVGAQLYPAEKGWHVEGVQMGVVPSELSALIEGKEVTFDIELRVTARVDSSSPRAAAVTREVEDWLQRGGPDGC